MLQHIFLVVVTGLLTLFSAVAQSGTGGLHLEGYCQDHKQRLVLVEYSALGWRCLDDEGEVHEIDLVDVCEHHYHGDRPHPFPDIYNPFSWKCLPTITTSALTALPDPPNYGGGLDLGPYCQYGLQAGVLTIIDENSRDGYVCLTADNQEVAIDMNVACQWQYPFVVTRPVSTADSPDSWICQAIE